MFAVAKKTSDKSDEAPFSRQVGFRIIDPALWEGLQELIGEQEYPTTISDVVTIALREHLKAKGKYRPRRKPD